MLNKVSLTIPYVLQKNIAFGNQKRIENHSVASKYDSYSLSFKGSDKFLQESQMTNRQDPFNEGQISYIKELCKKNPEKLSLLDTLLTSCDGKLKGSDVIWILEGVNKEKEKHVGPLLSKGFNGRDISFILESLTKHNENQMETLLNPELELSGFDIGTILSKITKDNQEPVESLIKKHLAGNNDPKPLRTYSDKTKDIMYEIKAAARKFNLPDFYAGVQHKFGTGKDISIEHLTPHSQKEEMEKRGIDVNDLGNFVPVGKKLNKERGHIPLKEWFRRHPDYFQNAHEALKEYEKVDSPSINGKKWVEDIKKTLNREMGYLAFTGKNIKKQIIQAFPSS